MAFLQQPVRYHRVMTPLMMKKQLPNLSSVEQRMMLILLVVVILVLFLLGLLVRQFTTSVMLDGAEALGLTGDVAESEPAMVLGLRTEEAIISQVFTPEVQYWSADIERWAAAHDSLTPDMVATVMQIESCGDPQALSGAGAMGLFQVMPFHFGAGEDSYNPDTNAMRGMNYLAERLVQTNGNLGLAFAGYNGGHVAAGGTWDDWSHETQRYFVWSTGIYNDIQAGLIPSPTLQRWLAAGGASLCQQAAQRLGVR